jgi:uncharacterized protein
LALIDFHAHMGRLYREGYPEKHYLTAAQLVDRMNRDGVDMSVILPLESPEGHWGWLLTEEVIAARDQFPDRLIAFMCIDPRYPNLEALFDVFIEKYGCKGFGEHVPGLPFNHELNKVIYGKCDEHSVPIDIEIGGVCTDEPGLPGLEECLREFPNCIFVGHGPGFWANISGEYADGYPPGPVKPGGAIDRLMADYENLYADISAGSGWNAISRDPDFYDGFIERNWRRLMYGSDIMFASHEIPQVEWMRRKRAELDVEVFSAIAEGNARRILKLDEE